jgi:hypothetical protein
MTLLTAQKMLRKFRRNRRGTAEVIGSILFIIIILFFFTNVYLWHDNATKQMNTVLSDKMNSPVSVKCFNDKLIINNNGGIDVTLSRLWVTNNVNHIPVSFDTNANPSIIVKAGRHLELQLGVSNNQVTSVTIQGTPTFTFPDFPTNNPSDPVTFKILTSLGNTASCEYVGIGLGPYVVADSGSFKYYPLTAEGGTTYTFESPSGSSNYIVNSGTKVFSVTLTNNDPNRREIELDANSQLYFLNTTNPADSFSFYVVGISGDGNTKTISTTYSQISLPYNLPTTVYFAAKSPMSDFVQFQPVNIAAQTTSMRTFALNLALFGSIGGSQTLGQNIPFNSLIVT